MKLYHDPSFAPFPLERVLFNNLIFNKSPLGDLGANYQRGAFESNTESIN